jgi:hypothetical protein
VQPFRCLLHLKDIRSGASPAPPAGEKTMEIAAILMLASVVLGVAQQFDPPVW